MAVPAPQALLARGLIQSPLRGCTFHARYPALRCAACRAAYNRRSAASPHSASHTARQAPEAQLYLARHEAKRNAGYASAESTVPEGRLTSHPRQGGGGMSPGSSIPWIPLTKRANPAKNIDSAGGMFRTSGFRSGSRLSGRKELYLKSIVTLAGVGVDPVAPMRTDTRLERLSR